MLLYCRIDEKMTINSTEMTLGVSAVPQAALAAGSWVFSAAPAFSVPAAVAEGLEAFLSSPFPCWVFPG